MAYLYMDGNYAYPFWQKRVFSGTIDVVSKKVTACFSVFA